jgi:hypothetical protein
MDRHTPPQVGGDLAQLVDTAARTIHVCKIDRHLSQPTAVSIDRERNAALDLLAQFIAPLDAAGPH